jgi:glycosyltransferase involved in cell wall biosynthesis
LKNILYITASNPFGKSHGAQQRSFLLFEALQQLGHVHVFCITNDSIPVDLPSSNYTIQFFGNNPNPKSKPRRYKLLRLFSPYVIHSVDPYLQQKLAELVDKIAFDHIVVRYVYPIYMCGLFERRGLIVDVDDHPVQYFMSMARNRKLDVRSRLFYLLDAIYSRIFLPSFLRRSKKAFFSNPAQVIPDNGIYLPNVPMPPNAQVSAYLKTNINNGKKRILFVGTMQYTPNLHGVDHFITHIWPEVITHLPNVQFDIVGEMNDGLKRLAWESMPGVNVHGFVSDLDAFYEDCSLVIVPSRQGAGTHIKVLEAMQRGKPTVITTFAARGFSDLLVHKENTWVAQGDESFIEGIIHLLLDDEYNHQMGKNAADALGDLYTVESFNRIVAKALS